MVGVNFDGNEPFEIVLIDDSFKIIPDETGGLRGKDIFDNIVGEGRHFLSSFSRCQKEQKDIFEILVIVGYFVQNEVLGHGVVVAVDHFDAYFNQKPDKLFVEVVHSLPVDVFFVGLEYSEEVLYFLLVID